MSKLKKKSTIVNESVINKVVADQISPPQIIEEKKRIYFSSNLVGSAYALLKFPEALDTSWLKDITNQDGVYTSIRIEPLNTELYKKGLFKALNSIKASRNLLQQNSDSELIFNLDNEEKSILKQLKRLDQKEEKMVETSIMYLPFETDEESLRSKEMDVNSYANGNGINELQLTNRQLEAFLAITPYNTISEHLWEKTRHTFSLRTLLAGSPFSTKGFSDGQGLLIGYDFEDGAIIYDNWYRGGDRANGNEVFAGGSGFGKSTAVKLRILHQLLIGSRVIIIDPNNEYSDIAHNFGGDIVALGGKGGLINILQPLPLPRLTEDYEEQLKHAKENDGLTDDFIKKYNEDKEESILDFPDFSISFQTVRCLLRYYASDMNEIEASVLEETLLELYKIHGIDDSTDLRQLDPKQCPIMSDLYNFLAEKKAKAKANNDKTEEIFDRLQHYFYSAAIGSDSHFLNGHTSIDLTNRCIVINTYHLMKSLDVRIKKILNLMAFNFAWSRIIDSRLLRDILVVDEGYLYLDPEMPEIMVMLYNIVKQIRKFNSSLYFIIHDVDDALDKAVKRYGKAIMSMPIYKNFFNTDGDNLLHLKELFNLTQDECDFLSNAKQGECIFYIGSKKLVMKVYRPEWAKRLLGSGGANISTSENDVMGA